jgi:hypothetical protein
MPMKRLLGSIAGLSVLCLLGCDTGQTESREVNTRIVQSLNNAAIRKAVIRQHTLYPYHFVPDCSQLNELGERELEVLAEYYCRHPGTLNIRRSDTDMSLYEGRVSTVRDRLAAAGVVVGRMTFRDGMAGGDGRPAAEVIAISEDRNSPSAPLYYGGSSGGSRSTGEGLFNLEQ